MSSWRGLLSKLSLSGIAGGTVRVRLLCLDAIALEKCFTVDAFPAVIGRDPEADVFLDDTWASRQHCELDLVDGHLFIRDLDSRNGTFINGKQIQECSLKPGDKLTVGLSTFEVQYDSKHFDCSNKETNAAVETYTVRDNV